jgi:hypothetical protein
MRILATLIGSTLVLLSSLQAAPNHIPLRDSTRIFFIGNSLFGKSNPLSGYLQQACAVTSPPIHLKVLQRMATAADVPSFHTIAKREITKIGQWDMLVTQVHQSQVVSPDQAIRDIVALKHFTDSMQLQLVIWHSWPLNPAKSQMAEPVFSQHLARIDSVEQVLNKLGITTIPTGQLLGALVHNPPDGSSITNPRLKKPDGSLILDWMYDQLDNGEKDLVHCNIYSNYFSCYLSYAVLTQRDPRDIQFWYISDKDPSANNSIEAPFNEILKQRSWDFYQQRLNPTPLSFPLPPRTMVGPSPRSTTATAPNYLLNGRLQATPLPEAAIRVQVSPKALLIKTAPLRP